MYVRQILPLLLCLAIGACASPTPNAVFDASATLLAAAQGASELAGDSAGRRAIWEASSRLRSSVPRSARQPELTREAFLLAVGRHDASMTTRLRAAWIAPHDDLKVRMALVELAMRSLDYDSARALAWAAAEDFEEARPALMRLWYRTFSADPVFLPDNVMTLSFPGPIDAIEHLGGGSSITFRFRRAGQTIAAFKPMQNRLQSNYRSEVAAYRLCPLIHCRFDVPHNREVRISRQDFLALNGRHSDSDVSRFDRRYDDLVWFEDEHGVDWLHGTMKEWIPEFRLLGIEFRSTWRPLVQHDREIRDDTIEETMGQLFNTSNRSRTPRVGDIGDLDHDTLARQISNLHVFDLMLNNWDRYSRHYTGVNCQWHHEQFVSIDNGAAFPLYRAHGTLASRVEYNFNQIEMFSERTVNSIRWMEPTALFPILFPTTPHHEEKQTFAAFMDRRKWFLEQLDERFDEFGEEAVLAFD
ncbi:MAG: hypothetical protein ACJAYU_000400 [Bradymonadia bacterium]|jgi:hypothetical protein